jgi:hypothetical protein
MGMRAHYVELDSEDMTRILDDREAACEILMGSSMGGVDMQAVFGALGMKDADLKAMEKMLGPMPSFMKGSSSATPQKKRPNLGIEKSWHAIHFVLNGDPWKGSGLLFNTVLGGKEIGEDMGYGRARYLDPFVVVQTSTALDRMTDDEFKKKARAADFSGKDIYVYGDQLSGDDFEELVYFFQQIRAFFHAVADKGNGILLGIV